MKPRVLLVGRIFLFAGPILVLTLGTPIFLWGIEGEENPSTPFLSDEALEAKIKEAQALYQSKVKALEDQVNRLFEIHFATLSLELASKMNEFNLKMAVVHQIQDPAEKERRTQALEAEYEEERFYRFMEAYYYLQNEIEKDHAFVADLLSRLEEVLNRVIEKDSLFRYAFTSREFKSKYGLVLRRVVWQPSELGNVSAETKPLQVHSIFADKTKVPVLMKLTRFAFTSLAFLRSILVHELNHVCFYKDPRFRDARQFGGLGKEAPKGEFTHYFTQLNPYHPSYQYQLVNEYYSFKAQLLFDDQMKEKPYFKLSEEDRKNFGNTLEWIYSQLNESNKQFVKENPEPPIQKVPGW